MGFNKVFLSGYVMPNTKKIRITKDEEKIITFSLIVYEFFNGDRFKTVFLCYGKEKNVATLDKIITDNALVFIYGRINIQTRGDCKNRVVYIEILQCETEPHGLVRKNNENEPSRYYDDGLPF